MKILWAIFICVLTFYIDCCQCEDFTLDTESDQGRGIPWKFSSTNFYIYGQNLTGLRSNITLDRPTLEMPDNFWVGFNTTNVNAAGIWGLMYYRTTDDRTPSITFSYALSHVWIGNISLSYFIYGNGYITVSADHHFETFDNCQNRPPELVPSTTEPTSNDPTESTSDSTPTTKELTTVTTESSSTETPVEMSCNTENRQWNHTTVDFTSCNQTTCTGVMSFTVTFHFQDNHKDNYETDEGFIFLDKIVATERIPSTPPTDPPGPPENTTTTTSTTTTETTTKSLSTPLTPGFFMMFLTIWVMLLAVKN